MALLEELDRIITPVPSLPLSSSSAEDFPAPSSSLASFSEGNPYAYTRVDRSGVGASDLPTRILHTLVHRLDIQSTLYRPQQARARPHDDGQDRGRHGRSRRATRSGAAASQELKSVKGESVLDGLMKLQASNDVTARSEVHRLLLDRRFLTPFIVPDNLASTKLSCDVGALELFSTVIDHDGEDALRSCLPHDSTQLRVAALSQCPKETSTSADWIKSVFHVNSLHAMDCDAKLMMAASTAAEIGWGFLLDSDQKYVPVVLLHPFIGAYCDALVVEMGNSDAVDIPLSAGCLLKWSLADPDEESLIESEEGASVLVESLRCRFRQSSKRITESLLDEIEEPKKRSPKWTMTLLSAVSKVWKISKIHHIDFETTLASVDFTKVRDQLRMQVWFAEESQDLLACQRENDPMKLRAYQTRRTKLRERRRKQSITSNQHVLIRVFRSILQNPSSPGRVIGVLGLGRFLSLSCEEQSARARKAYRQARDAYHDNQTPAIR
ncbi:unnamed protein product [Aphanomyces euteiches]